MPHVRVEHHWTRLEPVQPILRTIEPPWHRKGVRHAVMRKYPHVGRSEDLRLCLELYTVAGGRHAADLRSHIFEPWKYITIRRLAGSTWTSGEAICGVVISDSMSWDISVPV